MLKYEMRLESHSPNWGGKPLNEIVTGSVTLSVVSVQSDGSARVQLLTNLDPPNEKQNPIDYQLLIGADGEVLNDLGGQAYLLTTFFPILPLLPAKPSQPGATWTLHNSVPNSITGGAIQFDTHAIYEGDESRGGERLAIVKLHMLGSIDWTTTLGRLWGPSPPAYTAATFIHDVGSVLVDDTFSYDPARDILVDSTTTMQWNFIRTYLDPVSGQVLNHQSSDETQTVMFTLA